MKPGYILLEILIGMAIASMLSMILFTGVTQSGKAVAAIVRMISRNDRSMLFFRQWQRDVSSVFVPMVVKEQEKQKTPQPGQPAGAAAPQQRIELEPLKNAFSVEVADNRLKQFSFVTTNRLPSYDAPKPRMVRVTYFLEADVAHKGSFMLMRQEGPVLPPQVDQTKETEQPKKFLLLDGVQELSLECVVTVTQDPPKEGGEPAKKKVTSQEWPAKELENNPGILLPDLVRVTLRLWDEGYKTTNKFALQIPINIKEQVPSKPQAQPVAAQAKTAAKPGQTNNSKK